MSGLLSWLPTIGAAPSGETDEEPPPMPRTLPVHVFPSPYAYRAELIVDGTGASTPVRLPVPPSMPAHAAIITDLTINWFECHSDTPGLVLRLRLHNLDACTTWANDDPTPLTYTFPRAPFSRGIDQCVYRFDASTISQRTMHTLALSADARHPFSPAELEAARRPFLFAANITGDLLASAAGAYRARITFYVRAAIITARPVR